MSALATDQNTKNKPSTDQQGRKGGKEHVVDGSRDRRSVFKREKDEYGGVKVGLAFFGWLTATGTAVMLRPWSQPRELRSAW